MLSMEDGCEEIQALGHSRQARGTADFQDGNNGSNTLMLVSRFVGVSGGLDCFLYW